MKTKQAFLIGCAIIFGLALAGLLAISAIEVYTECTETHSVGYCLTVLSK